MKLGDIVWVNSYEFKVYSLPDNNGDMKIILDEGYIQNLSTIVILMISLYVVMGVGY